MKYNLEHLNFCAMALKSKELRIGNIINYDGLIGEVVSIGHRDEWITFKLPKQLNYFAQEASLRKCNGVPLTDEWLERAGFEMLPEWIDKKRDGATAFLDLGYLNISKNMMGGINLFDNNGLSTGVGIDYVHELQNIYFDLKGIELKFKERGKEKV